MEWNGIIGLVSVAIGMGLGFAARTIMAKMQAQSIERQATSRKTEADRDARSIRKEAEIQARSEVLRVREKFEQEVKEQRHSLETLRGNLTKRETALAEREENLDRKSSILDRKEQTIDRKLESVDAKLAVLETREKEAKRLEAEAAMQLQKLAGMTRDEARRSLFSRTEHEVRAELGTVVRRLEEETRKEADRTARDILLDAMHRYALSHASEAMTTSVPISSTMSKGHIIGKDGRNIRTLEAVTGVTILMDDTPDAILISGFDPVRREVARRAIEELLEDGRIHPTRIEETVAKIRQDLDKLMTESGEEVIGALGLQNVAPEVARAMGRLHFRTSFSQNVLVHSREVGTLMGMMASELGLDADIARRVGLFHDIGKAMDHEAEGPHAAIGAALLRKNGESPEVVAGVEFHHERMESSVYAMLCSTADAISSARPGARSEVTEMYINRVSRIEEIAAEQAGVKKAYAVQAGRELRIIVDPEAVGDAEAKMLARDVTRTIKEQVNFPGQIRVVVIRETRCVEYAR